jgi:hypothetical protein
MLLTSLVLALVLVLVLQPGHRRSEPAFIQPAAMPLTRTAPLATPAVVSDQSTE